MESSTQNINERTSFIYGETLKNCRADLYTKILTDIDVPKDINASKFSDKEHNDFSNLKRLVCAFLNTKGGRIYIGIQDKQVCGVKLDHQAKENLRSLLYRKYSDFFPDMANDKMVEVYYLPLLDDQNEQIPNMWVVKILVLKGENTQLYSLKKENFVCFEMTANGRFVELNSTQVYEKLEERISGNYIPKGDCITKMDPFPKGCSEY
jgi:predicted HTH transcriptional regulator